VSDAFPALDRRCWQRALGALNRREHSRAELQGKLEADGFGSDHIAAVLDALIANGWLDDARYAGAMARTRTSAGQGPRRIKVELARKGVTEPDIDAALETCDVDWATQARALVVRRFGADDLRGSANARKAVEFLLRRGFSLDIARAALFERMD